MAVSTLVAVAAVAALVKLTAVVGLVVLRRRRLARRGLDPKWWSAPRRI
ncbi:MAG: hypothetical protein ABR537_10490 [Gemmatimonadales bacterium]